MTRNCWSKNRGSNKLHSNITSHIDANVCSIQGSEFLRGFLVSLEAWWSRNHGETVKHMVPNWMRFIAIPVSTLLTSFGFSLNMSTESFQAQTEVMFCQPPRKQGSQNSFFQVTRSDKPLLWRSLGFLKRSRIKPPKNQVTREENGGNDWGFQVFSRDSKINTAEQVLIAWKWLYIREGYTLLATGYQLKWYVFLKSDKSPSYPTSFR